jgi:hypothetical protein
LEAIVIASNIVTESTTDTVTALDVDADVVATALVVMPDQDVMATAIAITMEDLTSWLSVGTEQLLTKRFNEKHYVVKDNTTCT